ncbi:hypothetical protein [Candidatus Poriferisodalis sp.]
MEAFILDRNQDLAVANDGGAEVVIRAAKTKNGTAHNSQLSRGVVSIGPQ